MANKDLSTYKARYLAMRKYEDIAVKNLKPMLGSYGDNEAAAQFINRAVKKREELFGSDVVRNAASPEELVTRALKYMPPAPQPKPPAQQATQGVMGRAKEAVSVAKDLLNLATGGAKTSIDMGSIHSGAAVLARPSARSGVKEIDESLRKIPVIVNGKIDEGGRRRSMTDADRAELQSFKNTIGLQQDAKGGDAYGRSGPSFIEKLKKRVGATGEVLDFGIAWMERQAKQTADMNVPVLSKAADAVVQPALVGARAAIANLTSGDGKYYKPEVRDERYFSEAAKKELASTLDGMKGRSSGRADGMDNAAQFNLTQTIGGFSVQNGKVTDKFDINKSYHGVPDTMTNVARAVLGAEEDPDAGKVKTAIPLDALRKYRQASKAGDSPRKSELSNFLATDKVPETLFGIPVVASPEQYTESDIAFFQEHPKAGGFYELGDEDTDTQAAEGAGATSFVTGLPTSDREFSRSFESKPVIEVIDGKTYYFPTIDEKGNYDIQGYRSYWSDKKNRMITHTSSGKLPEKAFIKGRDYTDQYTDTMATKLYTRHGADPRKLGIGAKYAAWDIAFNTGGNALVNSSEKIDNIVKALKRKGLTAEESLTVALALEQDTYGGRNYRRQSARGGAIMDDLAKSKSSLVQEFVQAYRTGWSGAKESSTPAMNEMSYGTNWAKHSAGMRSLSAIADKYKLDYTKRSK